MLVVAEETSGCCRALTRGAKWADSAGFFSASQPGHHASGAWSRARLTYVSLISGSPLLTLGGTLNVRPKPPDPWSLVSHHDGNLIEINNTVVQRLSHVVYNLTYRGFRSVDGVARWGIRNSRDIPQQQYDVKCPIHFIGHKAPLMSSFPVGGQGSWLLWAYKSGRHGVGVRGIHVHSHL
jgi:hypothetical protein